MRLFVDCRWLAQHGQGVVTYIAQLHDAVLRMPEFTELDLTIVYGVPSLAEIDPSLLPQGVEVIETGHRSFLWRLLVMPFWLSRHAIDAAHFQYVTPLYRLRARYIVTIHDIIFVSHPQYFSRRHRWLRWPFYRYSTRTADLVLTVSEQSKRDIARFFGRQDVVVIHNGFPPNNEAHAAIAPAGVMPETRYILTVGRVEPRKNYPRLVAGFENSGLAEQGYKLVIVGFCHEEFAGELQQIVGRQGIIFLDYVTDANLAWLYRNARAFIYPSICEGFGIPVLEAIDHGLPCAVSSTYPLEDVKQASAVTFDPLDERQIADACRTVATATGNPASADTLRRVYDWKKSAAAYVRAIEKMCRAR